MAIPGLDIGQGASPSSTAVSGTGPNSIGLGGVGGGIVNTKTLIDEKAILLIVGAVAAFFIAKKLKVI